MMAWRYFGRRAIISCALAFANGLLLAWALVMLWQPYCWRTPFCAPFESLVAALNALMWALNIWIVWRWVRWRRAMRALLGPQFEKILGDIE